MKERQLEMKMYKFTDLQEKDIQEIEAIFQYWYRVNRTDEEINQGLYINDHVDFRALSRVNYQGQGIGRIFCLEEEEEKLAYVLSFDTLEFTGKREYYLKLITPFVEADRSFIYNIMYLEHIAFIFHVGVAAKYQHSSIGRELLNRAMDFYVNTRKTRLIASTLDSGQFGMIRMLEEERPNMVFLNQEFSEQNNAEIRVRVAELIDLKTFRKKINESYLQGTYDFVIPMQLNIATESVNRMLKETGVEAKILWTSFFHNVPELTSLNNINQFYHGFYQPIRESAKNEWAAIRRQQIQTLRNISDYLKQKHENEPQKPGVASLIPSMEKEGFEFFFINDDPDKHDFSHFATPKVYQLSDKNSLNDWLASEEHYIEPQFLTPEEKLAWYGVLSKLVKALLKAANEETKAKRWQEWNAWRERLCLSDEENDSLLRFQREVISKKDPKIAGFGELVKKVNDRALVPLEERERWKKWFSLHEELYESDVMLRKKEGKPEVWWCHGVVPISFSQGISGVMFTFTCEKPATLKPGKVEIVSSLADIIANSLSRNMLNIVNKLYLNNFKTALSRFKTAALSARNLSHNVGSHVYSFLSQPNELESIIWEDQRPENIPPGFAKMKGVKDLTTFFDFTKIRMSLLADMATNEPVASTTEWLRDNLLQAFKEQEILKKYVKGNSKRAVSVKFYNEDVQPEKGEQEKDWRKRQEATDVQIQVPNGILGKSAFLMIMINYLRNSIKYAPYQQTGEIALTIKLKSAEKSKRLYALTLHDNVERDYAETVDTIKIINEKYIKRDGLYDDEFRLVQEGLGFSEMVAAARYLRKRPFRNSWVMPNFKPEVFLKAVFVEKPDQPKRGYLGVEFNLKRPRPLLIIDEFPAWNDHHDRIDKLNSVGIKVRFSSELKGWNLESFSHEIGIVLCDEIPSQLKTTRAFTPRMLKPSNPEVWRARFQDKKNTETLETDVWRGWIDQFRHKHEQRGLTTTLAISDPDRRTTLKAGMMLYDDHGSWLTDRSPQDITPQELGFYEFFRDHTATGLLVNYIHKAENYVSVDNKFQFLLEEANKEGLTKAHQDHLDKLTGREEMIDYLLKEAELTAALSTFRQNAKTFTRAKEKFTFLLEEAAVTRVVIIDERIQQMLRNHSFGKELSRLEQHDAFAYLRGMGIYVPDPNEEGNPNFDDPTTFRFEQDKLLDYLKRVQRDHAADFVVIHIGLIETMLGNSSEILIDEWIDAQLPENDITEYVMISGRGKPMAIPERFRYLPYNSISRAVLDDCPSKYQLCQNLYSSRTRT